MTEQKHNDTILNQYLKGESELSKQYQELPSHTPPPELDATILAAAHHELQKTKSKTRQWIVPLSVAATLVLSVSMLRLYTPAQLISTDKEMDSLTPLPASPSVLSEKADSESVHQGYTSQEAPKLKKKERRIAEKQLKQQFTTEEETAIVEKAAPSPARMFLGVQVQDTLSEAPVEEKEQVSITAEPVQPAEKWLKNIEKLLEEGKITEAQKAYKAFMEKYPDYPVKPELVKRLFP